MYKNNKTKDNNIKESDIIKALEKMIAFAGGLGIGVMYQKHKKDIINYMKRMTNNI